MNIIRQIAKFFVLLPLLLASVASASDGELTPTSSLGEEHRQTDTCIQLFAAATSLPSLSAEAAAFLQMARIGMDNVPPGEQSQLQHNLRQALTMPFATNPFTNLSSYQGKAFAQQIEETIEGITASDWIVIQDYIKAYFENLQATSDRRASDRQQTRTVRGFQFLSYTDITNSFRAMEQTKNSEISSAEYVGQASGGQLLFKFMGFSPQYFTSLASVSMPTQAGALPNIVWISHGTRDQTTPEFRSMNPMQQAFALGKHSGEWLLDGRLYAIFRHANRPNDLVELDPASGSIIDQIQFPTEGLFHDYGFSDGKFVMVRYSDSFDDPGKWLADKVYYFYPAERKWELSGLDLTALKLVQGKGLALLTVKLNYEREFLNTPIEIRIPEAISSSDPGFFNPWAGANGYTTYQQVFHRRRPNQINLLIQPRVVRVSIADYLLFSVDEILKRLPKGQEEREIILTYSSMDRQYNINVFQMPAINMNLVVLPSDGTLGDMWTVDTATLQIEKLNTPEEQVQRLAKTLGGRFDQWNVAKNEAGQIVVTGINREAERMVSWILNAETRQFEIPVVGPLPRNVDHDPEELGPSTRLLYSKDQRSVIAEIVKDGIWLLSEESLSREAAP